VEAVAGKLELGFSLLARVVGHVRLDPNSLTPLVRVALQTLPVEALATLQVQAMGEWAGGGEAGAWGHVQAMGEWGGGEAGGGMCRPWVSGAAGRRVGACAGNG
jgi:hypothetical protein